MYRFRSDFLLDPCDNIVPESNLLVSFVLPSSIFPVTRVSNCCSCVDLLLTSEVFSVSLGLLPVVVEGEGWSGVGGWGGEGF